MNTLNDYYRSTVRSIGFLSRIPVADHFFDGTHSTADDAGMYPVAGTIIALPSALVIASASFAPGAAWVLATLAIGMLIALTGALHEDGLADVTDGFFATREKERALDIMRDPTVGTFGSLALIISVLTQVASIVTLTDSLGAISTAFIFIGAAAGSRALMVIHWRGLENARADGKAAAGQPSQQTARLAVIVGAIVYVLFAMVFAKLWIAAAVAAGGAVLATFAFARLCRSRIGGHTGDTIGATQQLTVLTMLVILAIMLSVTT